MRAFQLVAKLIGPSPFAATGQLRFGDLPSQFRWNEVGSFPIPLFEHQIRNSVVSRGGANVGGIWITQTICGVNGVLPQPDGISALIDPACIDIKDYRERRLKQVSHWPLFPLAQHVPVDHLNQFLG